MKSREFWILESEYGMDIKRYIVSVCRTEKEALLKKRWLDEKDPYDKHQIFHVREVVKKEKK